MRLTFKIFALLDVISLVFMAMQVIELVKHIDAVPATTTSILKAVGMIVVFISLFFSAIGLFRGKKFGIITYYVQFPFRLLLWVFSLGFITLLPELFSRYEDYWFDSLFRICIVAEFFRLYFTVQFHKKLHV